MALERDEFLVKYDGSKITESEILKVCKNSGFPATVLSAATSKNVDSGSPISEFKPPAFYRQALDQAKSENKLLVLDFMATWCTPCKQISDETFVDIKVAELLQECILVTIDTDAHPELARHFNVTGLPDIRFLSPSGAEITQLLGFQNAEQFAEKLESLIEATR